MTNGSSLTAPIEDYASRRNIDAYDTSSVGETVWVIRCESPALRPFLSGAQFSPPAADSYALLDDGTPEWSDAPPLVTSRLFVALDGLHFHEWDHFTAPPPPPADAASVDSASTSSTKKGSKGSVKKQPSSASTKSSGKQKKKTKKHEEEEKPPPGPPCNM